jgi:4-amino-4-deoxy-L-arabinose transferase-like glycosyltransferase
MPWFLRRELGRAGAFFASVLLALSPSFLLFSRTLDGGILVAAGALGLLICALRYQDARRPAWLVAGAIGLAVLMLADASGWFVVLLFGGTLAWLAIRSAETERWRTLLAAAVSPRLGLFLAALLVLGSTGLLTNLPGLQHGLVDPLLAWLSGWVVTVAPRPWWYFLAALLAYEPLALFLAGLALVRLVGVSGLFQGWRTLETTEAQGRQEFQLFLAGWAVAALVWLTVAASKSPSAILVVLLPMVMLAAWVMGWLLDEIRSSRLVESGGLGLTWAFFLILLAVVAVLNPVSFFGGRFETLERQIQVVQVGIILLLSLGLATIVAWLVGRVGWRGSALSLALTGGMILTAFTVHSAWSVAYVPRENELLVPESTSVEVRTLVDDLAGMARFSGESGMGITVEPSLAYPLLWYLRDYRNVTVAAVVGPPKTPVVIVAREQDKAVQSYVNGYSARRYRLTATWQAVAQPGASVWAWLTNRVPLGPAGTRELTMYVSR